MQLNSNKLPITDYISMVVVVMSCLQFPSRQRDKMNLKVHILVCSLVLELSALNNFFRLGSLLGVILVSAPRFD